MPKVYSVGLAWTDADRSELVEDTDERARFMAYGPGLEVPDRHVDKVNKKIRPVGEDKQRTPASKDATPKPGLHTGGASSVKGA